MFTGCPVSPGGKGLFLGSTSVAVEDVGVGWLELAGDCVRLDPGPDEEPWDGDEVPELESFFLDDLLGSLARESCSCWVC